jgi:hypothetical protein
MKCSLYHRAIRAQSRNIYPVVYTACPPIPSRVTNAPFQCYVSNNAGQIKGVDVKEPPSNAMPSMQTPNAVRNNARRSS